MNEPLLYPLLGIEAIHSILTAALLGAATGAVDYRPCFAGLIRAARDLGAGTTSGDDRSADIEASIGAAAPLAADQPLPAHLGQGNRLLKPVDQGTVITRDRRIPPDAPTLWPLRARQDVHVFSSPLPEPS